MRELKRLITEAKKNVTNGFGFIYERSIPKEPEEEEEQEAEPTTAEERSFKKRYGDLRRHTQKQQEDLQSQITGLKEQLTSATKKEMKLPKSDDEIDVWMSKYPDVAAIVETIAIKKAREQSTELEERVTKINKMQEDAERQKAETVLLQLHPDFDEIRQDDDFHTWAEEQPRWIQQAPVSYTHLTLPTIYSV